MNYDQALAAASHEARALGETLHGKALKSDTRSRVALGCFAVAQQHHSGIIILLSPPSPLQASAFSLLRPLAEATFRAFWVARCASDDKIENLLTESKKQIDTATIVRELIEAAEQSDKHAGFYQHVWPRLSAYTHTYEESLAPWLRGQDIEPNFTDEELLSLLKRASLSAQLIGAGVLSLLAQPDAA